MAGAFTHNGNVVFGLPNDASQVNFNKTGTDLTATKVDSAIKEVNTKANTANTGVANLRSDVDDTIGWDNHKNLLPVTLDAIKRNNTSGTWNDNVYTKDGITYTILLGNYNEVLGIDVDGTATAFTDLQITDIVDVYKYTGKIINGMPSNNLSGFKLSVAQNTSPWTAYRDENGSGATIGQYTGTTGYAYVSVGSGETVSHAIVRPMISDNGGEFEPYHQVIGETLNELKSGLANLKMIPITITDTVPVGSRLSNGVLLSVLTGGIITSFTQVKGLAMFNHRPTIVHWLQYEHKLIFAYDDDTSDGTYTYHGVLFY